MSSPHGGTLDGDGRRKGHAINVSNTAGQYQPKLGNRKDKREIKQGLETGCDAFSQHRMCSREIADLKLGGDIVLA
jgi:hypothetical protein